MSGDGVGRTGVFWKGSWRRDGSGTLLVFQHLKRQPLPSKVTGTPIEEEEKYLLVLDLISFIANPEERLKILVQLKNPSCTPTSHPCPVWNGVWRNNVLYHGSVPGIKTLQCFVLKRHIERCVLPDTFLNFLPTSKITRLGILSLLLIDSFPLGRFPDSASVFMYKLLWKDLAIFLSDNKEM